jgi:NFU1 iron-sulfur cluster scaffold homolog, mitochondrial
MEDGTMDFVAARYTHISPLAKKLFTVDGVNRVFYGKDYISISKTED